MFGVRPFIYLAARRNYIQCFIALSCREKWPVDSAVMERKVMLEARRALLALLLLFLLHCTWMLHYAG